jgi:ankyrin repeat protein
MQPIHAAIERHDLEEVRRILASDPTQVHEKTDAGDSPIHLAAWQDQPAIVLLLLNSGANVAGRGEGGNTPLHYAAKNGSVEVATVLVNRRATIDARNASGETPLVFATHGGTPESFEVGRLLADHGAKLDLISAIRLGSIQHVQELLRNEAELTPKSSSSSLLDAAIGTESPAIVQALLDSGVNPNQTHSGERPPIFLAAELAIQSGLMDIVQLLLRHGADPSARNEYGEALPEWIEKFGSSQSLPTKMLQAKNRLQNILKGCQQT